MKFVQANLQRKRLATQELILEAKKRKISVALVQEPYVGSGGELAQKPGYRVIQCTRGRSKPVKSAIIVLDEDINIICHPKLTNENIAVAVLETELGKVGVVSIYFEGTEPIDPYLEQLKAAVRQMEAKSALIGGDGNAWSFWWGSEREDHRGEALASAVEEMGLQILNEGTVPTFLTVRNGITYKSIVDITACSTDILQYIRDWEVDKAFTSSDHNAITFKFIKRIKYREKIKKTTRRYNTKKANWEKFRNTLKTKIIENNLNINEINNIKTSIEIDKTVTLITEIIKQTSQESIPEIKTKNKVHLPWWSEQLNTLKKVMMTFKRRIPCAARTRRTHVIGEYLKAKAEYECEAENAQNISWKKFCGTQDRETFWEGVYRVIRKTEARKDDQLLIKNNTVLSPKESVELLAQTFFPKDDMGNDESIHRSTRARAEAIKLEKRTQQNSDPPFTEQELRHAAESFNPKKAPGEDGFTADICLEAIRTAQEVFLGLFNKCLSLSHFPVPYKEATVAVLRKPGKDDYSQPKAYRPIGLLPVLGKVLEKMIVRRLRWHLLPKSSPRQYGFVPQRSTEDALYDLVQHIKTNIKKKKICLLVSLDIEGAFDSAWWPAMICRLADYGCPENLQKIMASYLECRNVIIRYAGAETQTPTTKGCIQGSISGPTLWNILLDPLLEDIGKEEVHIQAFADDIVLVFTEDTGEKLQTRANAVLDHVYEWGVENKLKFAPHKTAAMILTNKMKYDTPRIRMAGAAIELVQEVKILGLILDNKLNFNSRTKYICNKAIKLYKPLARTAKISWGLSPEIIRTMYVAVIEPIVMYAASVWAPAVGKIKARKQLSCVQRGFVQKIGKTYRTVSLNAALIITGLLPLDLRVKEGAQIYEAKRGKPQDELKDREVEKKTDILKLRHPAHEASVTYTGFSDELKNPEEMNKEELMIFTDGSKIGGRVGAALTCWREGREITAKKYSLAHYCSVYQAEMFALKEAVKMVDKLGNRQTRIISDSESALQTLVDPCTQNKLAVEIRDLLEDLKKKGKTIMLHWVKAHVGVWGNERADILAKEAALKSKMVTKYDKYPVSSVKRIIRRRTVKTWEERYQNEETASTTKIFFPSAEAAFQIIKKIKMTPILTQAMTGHGGFGHYLWKYKCKDDPSCPCDNATDETIIHLLTECPRHIMARYDVEATINEDINPKDIYKILEDKDKREKFLEFCNYVTKKSIERNKTM